MEPVLHNCYVKHFKLPLNVEFSVQIHFLSIDSWGYVYPHHILTSSHFNLPFRHAGNISCTALVCVSQEQNGLCFSQMGLPHQSVQLCFKLETSSTPCMFNISLIFCFLTANCCETTQRRQITITTWCWMNLKGAFTPALRSPVEPNPGVVRLSW